MKNLLLAMAILFLAGCAVGNKYDYRSSKISLPLKSSDQQVLALQVSDLRSYVVNGQKNASFVGLQRGGFGNPFDVTTGSGSPLSDEMAVAIVAALTRAGYDVYQVKGAGRDALFLEGRKAGSRRFLLLEINEWKSDVFMGITLHCDLKLEIYDGSGEKLAGNTMKFVEGIGGAQIGGAKNSEAVTREFAKRIGYLFNKDEILKALK